MAFGVQPRPFDFLALFLSIGVAAFSALAVYGSAREEPRVIVEGAGSAWTFPLDAEETLRVPGPLGDTVVAVAHGDARVVASPCKNQTCVAAGKIHSHGQWTACLPNGVFLRIEGKMREDDIDAATW